VYRAPLPGLRGVHAPARPFYAHSAPGQDFGFRVSGFWLRVSGLGFLVSGFWFRV
jgi:hypothetical protein